MVVAMLRPMPPSVELDTKESYHGIPIYTNDDYTVGYGKLDKNKISTLFDGDIPYRVFLIKKDNIDRNTAYRLQDYNEVWYDGNLINAVLKIGEGVYFFIIPDRASKGSGKPLFVMDSELKNFGIVPPAYANNRIYEETLLPSGYSVARKIHEISDITFEANPLRGDGDIIGTGPPDLFEEIDESEYDVEEGVLEWNPPIRWSDDKIEYRGTKILPDTTHLMGVGDWDGKNFRIFRGEDRHVFLLSEDDVKEDESYKLPYEERLSNLTYDIVFSGKYLKGLMKKLIKEDTSQRSQDPFFMIASPQAPMIVLTHNLKHFGVITSMVPHPSSRIVEWKLDDIMYDPVSGSVKLWPIEHISDITTHAFPLKNYNIYVPPESKPAEPEPEPEPEIDESEYDIEEGVLEWNPEGPLPFIYSGGERYVLLSNIPSDERGKYVGRDALLVGNDFSSGVEHVRIAGLAFSRIDPPVHLMDSAETDKLHVPPSSYVLDGRFIIGHHLVEVSNQKFDVDTRKVVFPDKVYVKPISSEPEHKPEPEPFNEDDYEITEGTLEWNPQDIEREMIQVRGRIIDIPPPWIESNKKYTIDDFLDSYKSPKIGGTTVLESTDEYNGYVQSDMSEEDLDARPLVIMYNGKYMDWFEMEPIDARMYTIMDYLEGSGYDMLDRFKFGVANRFGMITLFFEGDTVLDPDSESEPTEPEPEPEPEPELDESEYEVEEGVLEWNPSNNSSILDIQANIWNDNIKEGNGLQNEDSMKEIGDLYTKLFFLIEEDTMLEGDELKNRINLVLMDIGNTYFYVLPASLQRYMVGLENNGTEVAEDIYHFFKLKQPSYDEYKSESELDESELDESEYEVEEGVLEWNPRFSGGIRQYGDSGYVGWFRDDGYDVSLTSPAESEMMLMTQTYRVTDSLFVIFTKWYAKVFPPDIANIISDIRHSRNDLYDKPWDAYFYTIRYFRGNHNDAFFMKSPEYAKWDWEPRTMLRNVELLTHWFSEKWAENWKDLDFDIINYDKYEDDIQIFFNESSFYNLLSDYKRSSNYTWLDPAVVDGSSRVPQKDFLFIRYDKDLDKFQWNLNLDKPLIPEEISDYVKFNVGKIREISPFKPFSEFTESEPEPEPEPEHKPEPELDESEYDVEEGVLEWNPSNRKSNISR